MKYLTDDKFSLGGRWLRGFDSLWRWTKKFKNVLHVGGNNINCN